MSSGRGDGEQCRPDDFDMEGRGDLRGGANRTRNAQIMALKRNFYSSPEDLPETEKRGGRGGGARRNGGSLRPDSELLEADELEGLLGLMKDMPLCRWENVMLPGFNQVLNVWQPVYTHMFESIIAKKQPWYYVHLQTPGGTDDLMNPEYALDDQLSKAPRVGVLMRIMSAERKDDSRLAAVVQGLMRVRIVEQTQKEPYHRATVQVLPDEEITASNYASATDLMPQVQQAARSKGPCALQHSESWIHTVAHAAAVASEMDWQEFENAFSPITVAGGELQTREVAQLCTISTAPGLEAKLAQRVVKHQQQAMQEALKIVTRVQQLPGNISVLGAPVLSATDLAAVGVLGRAGAQSGASLPSWDGWFEEAGAAVGGGAQLRLASSVSTLEGRLWVEVDALLRHYDRLGRAISIPSPMLGLLPDEPSGGWPADFCLDRAAKAMTALQLPPRPPPVTECAGQRVMTGRQSEFTRVGPHYDPLRRAQKLSYLACSLLGVDQGSHGQVCVCVCVCVCVVCGMGGG